MTRRTFNAEVGFSISANNGENQASIISGSTIPDGVSGYQATAEIGSIYLRTGTGELYQKIANSGNAADYQLNGSSTLTLGNWRPERVDAHTGQVLVVGATTPTAWSDNDDGTDANAFSVGNYVLDGNCKLWEITNVSFPQITLADSGVTQPVADDMFAVRRNMPDPAGQENQAIISYDGSSCIKIADVDFAIATGINLSNAYSPASGDIAANEQLESAIQKLDGNNDAQDSAIGISQGDTSMGTYTGALLNDNESAKQNIQQLETETEALRSSLGGSANDTDMGTYTGVTLTDNTDQRSLNQELETAIEGKADAQDVADLVTLSGMPVNSTDLGTFTEDIISDNTTVKNALQELETELKDTEDNTDDLITLSGVAENSTVLGAFALAGSVFLNATHTIKSALQKLGDVLAGFRGTQVTGVSTATVADSVPHASVKCIKWIVSAFEDASTFKTEAFEILAVTDGSSVDDTKYAKLKLSGGVSGLSATVAINGANLELQVNATNASTFTVRRIEVVKDVL